ncbi:hypothetical protein D6D13_05724 [Aureobasidium pullulans]|uniref:Uncharacterized protein n=1 Tax=Aureobasidium pullulans TaxID=5580 RepID=A0A4S9CRA3_AURPU|nr:hypothetical protein D6D13_05724 [Aureobasidium pullulans]
MDPNAVLRGFLNRLYDQALTQEQRITELENRLTEQHDKLVRVFILSAGIFVMLLVPFVVALYNRARFSKTEKGYRDDTRGTSDFEGHGGGSTIYTPSASDASVSEEALATSTISSSQIQVLEKLASAHNLGVRNTGIVPPEDKALSYNDTFLPVSYHNHFDTSSPLNTFTPTNPRPRNFGKLEPAQQRAWHRRNVQEKMAQQKKEQKKMEEAMRCSKMRLHEGSNSNTAIKPNNEATGTHVLGHDKERHNLPDFKDERVDDMIAELNRALEKTGDARLDADRSEVDKVILEGLRMGPCKR